jgi:hypothetical protein
VRGGGGGSGGGNACCWCCSRGVGALRPTSFGGGAGKESKTIHPSERAGAELARVPVQRMRGASMYVR